MTVLPASRGADTTGVPSTLSDSNTSKENAT